MTSARRAPCDPREPPADLIRSVSRAIRILESVGLTPYGLSVKQIARRCGLNLATAYHLVRTLTYEDYLLRRHDATYTIGPAIADRFRELVTAHREPQTTAILRQAALTTGYTHYLARLIDGRPTVTAIAYGPLSPWLDDLIPGFDDAAHATATGKALLATLTRDQRARYLDDHGMPPYTPHTLTNAADLETDLIAGQRHGMHLDVNEYWLGNTSVGLLAVSHRRPDHRIALGCLLPSIVGTSPSTETVKAWLTNYAREISNIDATAAMERYISPVHPGANQTTHSRTETSRAARPRLDAFIPRAIDTG